jgi:hypothetical protein
MQNTVRGIKKLKIKPVPKGRAKHIEIDLHDGGGSTVHSRHEGPKVKAPKGAAGMAGMGAMMGGGSPDESHEAAFQNPDDMMAHVGQMAGAAPSGPPSPDTPPAPAGGAPAPGAADEEAPEGE